METIKEGTQVKYIGKTNDYTFKDNLSTNSIGIVKNIFETDVKETYQVEVEFENGITTSIDLVDLEKLK
jgi:hypothetical protein